MRESVVSSSGKPSLRSAVREVRCRPFKNGSGIHEACVGECMFCHGGPQCSEGLVLNEAGWTKTSRERQERARHAAVKALEDQVVI